jgi:hypothetical protein
MTAESLNCSALQQMICHPEAANSCRAPKDLNHGFVGEFSAPGRRLLVTGH